jgi:hypothetical protein
VARLSGVELHRGATAATLGAARAYVMAIWILHVLERDFRSLAYLSPELFHAHGMMALLPKSALAALLDPSRLLALEIGLLALLAAALLGMGGRLVLGACAAALTLCVGFAKGFGGHVNHRELALLYVTYALVVLPCWDALALTRSREPARDARVYRAAMLALSSIFVANYLFVGLARVCMGFPGTFDPAVMHGWMLDRAVRPNPLGSTLALEVLARPWARALVSPMLPLSTLLELAAPLVFWLRPRPRYLLLLALAGFHAGILALMNIAFIENVLLLGLLVDYTPWLARLDGGGAQRGSRELRT